MLSGLTFGSREVLEATAQRSADRKSKKHHKKHKNKHRHKNKDAHASGSASSSSEDVGGSTAAPPPKHSSRDESAVPEADGAAASRQEHGSEGLREGWMVDAVDFQEMAGAGRRPNGAPEPNASAAGTGKEDNPDAHVGLRHMDGRRAPAPSTAADTNPLPTVGDGGASWRLKALKRAQQLAAEQGKDAATFITERWGSTAELTKTLTSGGAAAHGRAHIHEAMRRRQGDRPANGDAQPSSERRPHYLDDVRSEAAKMRRPAAAGGGGGGGGSSLSWRRHKAPSSSHDGPGAGAGSGAGYPRDRQEPSGGTQHKQHSTADDEVREGSRGPRRSRSPPRLHSSRGSPEQRQQPRHSPGADPRSPPQQRGDGRRSPEHQQERSTRHGRQRSPSRRSRSPAGRHRERHSSDVGSQQQARHNLRQDEAELLKRFAGTMNTFASDGSFLEQVQQQQRPDEAAAADGSKQPEGSPLRSPASPADRPAAAVERAPAVVGDAGNRGRAAMLRARLAGGQQADAAAAQQQSAAVDTGSNQSKAALLRAKLLGKPLPPATAAPAPAAAGRSDSQPSRSGREVVSLPLVDSAGRAAPGAFGRESAGAATRALEQHAQGRVPKRVQRYGEAGQKERYYADDDAVDLQTLVKRAKHGDDLQDIDRALISNIAAKARFKETDLDADAEYDYDAGLEMAEARHKRGDAEQQAARQRQAAISSFRRQERAEDTCSLCFNSSKRPRQLTIAIGQTTYLALVPRGRLVPGHCCIAPAEHVPSMRQVDDATWTEVRNFQKCLIQMFMAQGKEVIFMETAMNFGGGRQHAMLEAIPMDADTLARAPMYFRKGLEEAESEWSQHAAKSVIDTKVKGLRGSIPPHFPYFCVQFGYGNGFVHVIDNERKFDRDFGRQVLVGLLRLPAEDMHRRQRSDAPAVQEQQAREFRQDFAQYDWTKQLG